MICSCTDWSQGDGDIKRREDQRRSHIKPTSTLFVVNFNVEETRERDLEKHFDPYGRLVRVQIKRTYAFVQFETVDQAEAALKDTHLSRFMGAYNHPQIAVLAVTHTCCIKCFPLQFFLCRPHNICGVCLQGA